MPNPIKFWISRNCMGIWLYFMFR